MFRELVTLVREPLRLLIVGTHPEPGGAASHLVSLTTALASLGHRIAVVATPGSGIWRALEPVTGVTLYGATFTRVFESSAVHALRQAARNLRPTHVVSVFERDYWGSAYVAARLRLPLYLFVHHAGLKRANRIALPWLRRRFLLPSENLRQWLVARGVPAGRTEVLHNPINTCHFRPNAALRASTRGALGLANDAVVIGFVGRIESNKGVIPFANALNLAMARVPALHALWVGFGRREPDLDQIIHGSPFAHRHIRCPWVDDPLPYYSAIDMLALPSTGREAFGRVLVEAQACGIPVLGSNIGGIGETMQVDVTGRLVQPGDVDAWADEVIGMALNPAGRARMGATGRAFARSAFDSAVVAAAFERILRAPATY